MIKRRLIKLFPLFFITVLVVPLCISSNCYGKAFAYVPNNGDNTLSIIQVLDHSVIDTLDVGISPFGVAIGEEYIYVTNDSDGTVSSLSLTFNSLIKILDVGGSPKGIATTSDGVYIYVANYSDNTLSFIDVSRNMSASIPIGSGPLGVALSPYEDYLYVTNSRDDSLSVISAESNELFVTLKNHYYLYYLNETDDIAFSSPHGVAVSPDGYYIYVVNNGNNTLSIIYAYTIYSQGDDFDWDDYDSTDDEEGPYRLYEPVAVGNDPRCVAVDPDQEYLYVTNYADNTVSVIFLSSFSVTETIDVGQGPYGIAINPSGDFVYVVNQIDGTVSVIYTDHDNEGDYDDNSVIATVSIGSSPIGFGNFIGGKPPRTPSNLVADLEDTNTINITWSDNSEDELGFKLMRRRYIGGTFTLLTTPGPGVTEYTDSGLINDSNYYYKVSAYNYAGESDYSPTDYATTGNDDSGCFIASAAHGSSTEPHSLFPALGMSWVTLFLALVSGALVIVSFLFLVDLFIGPFKQQRTK